MMIGAALFRVSLSWSALAVAGALAAGPALAAGEGPQRSGGPKQQCFDPVAVVLGAKPHRAPEATARRAGGQAPADARPILTLVMERPRDCKAPLDWASAFTPSPPPGMFDGGGSDGFDSPLHPRLVGAEQGERAGDISLSTRTASMADPAAFPDPVPPEGPPAGGFTVGGGFVLPSSPTHGLTARAAPQAPVTPNPGFSAFTVPQGGASAVAAPPDTLSPTGDPPGRPAIPGGIAAVPEPSTWAVLVLGLFGLGATLRQRRPPPLGRAA